MTTYRIEMMTSVDYNNYMCGGNNYHTEIAHLDAVNAIEALHQAKALYPDMIINERYIKSLEEIKQQAEREKAEIEAEKRAELERKVKREKREQKKAEAVGMSVAEYRAEQNRRRNIKRIETEIAELKATLAKKERRLEELKIKG